jgi:hypothetical protein
MSASGLIADSWRRLAYIRQNISTIQPFLALAAESYSSPEQLTAEITFNKKRDF